MGHIDNFTIERFRGLRDLRIENLGQINLFVGNNNSGKTSVLEAASLFCDPLSWRRWYDIASQRELSSTSRALLIDRLIWLFPRRTIDDNRDSAAEDTKILLTASGSSPIIQVSASYENFSEIVSVLNPLSSKAEEVAEEREIETENIRIHVSVSPRMVQRSLFGEDAQMIQGTLAFSDYRPSPTVIGGQQKISLPSQIVNPFSHRTSTLTSQLWSEVVEADLKDETIKLLRFFDPAIQDVDFISPRERKQLISIKHARLGHVPLYTFGDGLRRVFTLAVTIPRVRGGLLLIDELETSIHTKALEKTFNWLVHACIHNNVQLFATTHSLEALDDILEVSREQADLVVYRLQQDHGQTSTTRLDKETTLQLREELGMELRY